KYFRMAGEFRTNEFDRDKTLKFGVARFVDGAHAALSQQGENFEALREKKSWFELALCCSFAGRPRRDGNGPRLRPAHRATHGSTKGFAMRRHGRVSQWQRRAALCAVVRCGRVIGLT